MALNETITNRNASIYLLANMSYKILQKFKEKLSLVCLHNWNILKSMHFPLLVIPKKPYSSQANPVILVNELTIYLLGRREQVKTFSHYYAR